MEMKDKPTPIASKTSSKHTLKQSGKTIIVIISCTDVAIGPIMVGHLVPQDDPNWRNYLLMMIFSLPNQSGISSHDY